jgi:hypothetical protein
MTYSSTTTKPHVTRDLLLYWDPPLPLPSGDVVLYPPLFPSGLTPLRIPAEAARKPRKPRRPSISKMIKQADKAGKPLASLTLPDGTKLDFDKPESVAPENPWPLDEFRTKETKQ